MVTVKVLIAAGDTAGADELVHVQHLQDSM